METMVFLTLLRTQLIIGEDAIDARCLPVERMLDGNVPLADSAPFRGDFCCTSSGLGFVFRHQQDSARKTLILRQDMTES